MTSNVPRPRHGHVAALIGNEMLLWGGLIKRETGEVKLLSNESIESFNLCTNEWSERQSTWNSPSDVPVPSNGATIAVVNDRYVYQYGGMYDSVSSSGDSIFCDRLYKLDGFTLKWEKISLASKSACPVGRAACGLCALGSKEDRRLIMAGGWGKSGCVQAPDSALILTQNATRSWNNEVWLFSVNESIWIPVESKGNIPSARSAFSFTAIDDNRALLIGGGNAERLNDAYVFELSSTEWTEIVVKGPDFLPPRMFHSTVVSTIPEVGPTAFVLWGYGKYGVPMSSGYKIVLDSLLCTKILTCDRVIPTSEQTVCCFSAKSHLFLLRFGGLSKQATTVTDIQISSDALLDISKIDLKNPAELIPHDISEPISRQFPGIVSVTGKDGSHQAGPFSSREVDRVAKLVGSRWREVARAVFPIFTDEEIDVIETAVVDDRATRFLRAWIERKNGDEATRKALCRALFEADLLSCVKEVFPDIYQVMTEEIPLTQIQRHELVYDEDKDFLAAGAFGEVFKATLFKGGREASVAVKVFGNFSRSSFQRVDEMFKKEAAVLLRIEPHGHVLRLIGVCASPRYSALVTEYISGGDLWSLLKSDDEATRGWRDTRIVIARQIALGMAHLHYNYPPVIHLDLKPQNVLVERVGKTVICKVCDFGLSKMSGVSSLSDDREERWSPRGTTSYIAPEGYSADPYGSGSKDVKAKRARKADVYSYGVVLWIIREKRDPYEGMLKVAIHLHAKESGKLPPAQAEAPKPFNELVNSCTEFDPEKRPTFRTAILMLTCLKQ